MENRGWVERIPQSVLVAVPLMCAAFNAVFLLLLRNNQRLQLSDFGQGAVCGVFLGISLLCLLVMWMKKRLAE